MALRYPQLPQKFQLVGSVWNPHRRSFTSQAILDQDNAWLAYVKGN